LRLDKLEEFAKISDISKSKLNYQVTEGVVKTSIFEPSSSGETMTRKELVVFLGTPLNTINQWVSEGRIKPTVGYKFEKSVVLKQLREYTQGKRDAKKLKSSPVVKSNPVPAVKVEQNYKIEFKKPFEFFIKDLCENRYLSEPNDKRFARFQSCYLHNDDPKIESGAKYVKSFVTFILVAAILGMIENTSDTIPDEAYGEDFIPMEPFFSNFERKNGWKESSVSNSKIEVMEVLKEIKDNTIKFMKENELSLKKYYSLKDILDVFFVNRDSIKLNNNYKEKSIHGCDLKMLEIMWKHYNKYPRKYSEN
jgi:hypothetical protein